jgi:hypothetical protein
MNSFARMTSFPIVRRALLSGYGAALLLLLLTGNLLTGARAGTTGKYQIIFKRKKLKYVFQIVSYF